MPSEEGVFPIEGDGGDQVFDAVVVDLDAPIVQESLQPVPMMMSERELTRVEVLAQVDDGRQCSRN